MSSWFSNSEWNTPYKKVCDVNVKTNDNTSIVLFNADKTIMLPTIEKVIFNDPATVVLWSDGTKTVVKTHNEAFSKEHGLAMAISKKYFGSRSKFLKECENAADKSMESSYGYVRPYSFFDRIFNIDQIGGLTD